MPRQTVTQLLQSLPADRRREVSRVRAVIKKHLPAGYQEAAEGAFIVFQVPADKIPDAFKGRPLWYAALGAPKSYLTLHLMPVYASKELLQRLTAGFATAGKTLDIGKACIHYQKADDLALEAIGDVVASTSMTRWIALATAAWGRK